MRQFPAATVSQSSLDFDQQVKMFLQRARSRREGAAATPRTHRPMPTARTAQIPVRARRTPSRENLGQWTNIAGEFRRARRTQDDPFAETAVTNQLAQINQRFEEMQSLLARNLSAANESKLVQARAEIAKANIHLERLYLDLIKASSSDEEQLMRGKKAVADSHYQVVKASYESAKLHKIINGQLPEKAASSIHSLNTTQVQCAADLGRELRAMRMEIERLAANQVIPRAVAKPAIAALTESSQKMCEEPASKLATDVQAHKNQLQASLKEAVLVVNKLAKTFPVLSEINLNKWVISLWSLSQLCLK